MSSPFIFIATNRLKPGAYTALVALVLGENLVSPEIATAQFRVEGSP